MRTAKIANLMPFGHAPNVYQVPDGRFVLTWFAGSHEGAEDQRIAIATRTDSRDWSPPVALLGRFQHAGDEWVPETSLVLPGRSHGLRLVFWACPVSRFRLIDNPVYLRRDGGWGGGSWFAYTEVPVAERIWTRDIAASALFIADFDDSLGLRDIRFLVPERGLVLYGRAVPLRSGEWLIPYHTEGTEDRLHSRFMVYSPESNEVSSVGDLFEAPGCIEPVVAELTDGSLVCFMRHAGFDGHIWRSDSASGPTGFQQPTATFLRNPNAGVDAAVSRTSGRLLLAFNDSYRLRTPLCVGISADNGISFRVQDIRSDYAAYGYPKILQDADGEWHLFYSRNYGHIEHTMLDEDWLLAGRPVLASPHSGALGSTEHE